MKKKIKVKFIGMWPYFYSHIDEIPLIKLLREEYDLQISDSPDYIICSVFGKPYDYCNYPQVRIMWSRENYVPDFNLIDYSISSYPINYLDRNLYSPACCDHFGRFESLQNRRTINEKDLEKKEYFCNFIASHESENNIRGDFFKKLCEYKRVESPGSYLNNMENGYKVDFMNQSKYEFQSKCKFSLCFESTRSDGFITEKITDAFYARTIPVYYGSKNVDEIFNKKAFINCLDYPNFDSVIERIKEIDNNDKEYLAMLNEPIFNDVDYYDNLKERTKAFFRNIFEQPYEQSYRRSRVYIPAEYNNICSNISNNYRIYKIINKLKKK